MPKFELAQQPESDFVIYDTDSPIDEDTLNQQFNNRPAITLCIRSESGKQQRGGYFFCLEKERGEKILLKTIEGDQVAVFLSATDIVAFINHVAGLEYSDKVQKDCQNFINFKND